MMFPGLLLVLGAGAAAVLAVIWLVRRTRTSEAEPGRQEQTVQEALEILKLRYARMKRELAED